jgi:hypothetical protein
MQTSGKNTYIPCASLPFDIQVNNVLAIRKKYIPPNSDSSCGVGGFKMATWK